jgi:nicotinamidase-related amidase
MQIFTKVGLDALLTPENCVLLLIDHQPFQLANINSHDPTIVINNVTALARTAKVYDIPTILTTVNEERGGLIFRSRQFFRIRRQLTVLSSMRGRTGTSSRR